MSREKMHNIVDKGTLLGTQRTAIANEKPRMGSVPDGFIRVEKGYDLMFGTQDLH